jgi:hypothetical protein
VLNGWPKRATDKFLGDLAYPIFVTHYLVGVVANWSMGGVARGASLFAV